MNVVRAIFVLVWIKYRNIKLPVIKWKEKFCKSIHALP